MTEVNNLCMATSPAKASMRAKIERIDGQIKRLVDAILAGADAKPMNVKLKVLEADQTRLAAELDAASEGQSLLHPNLARIYRERVESLDKALRDLDHGREAFENIRSLIKEVRLIPADGQVHVELAGNLAVAAGAKQHADTPKEMALQIKMVAGVGNLPIQTKPRIF